MLTLLFALLLSTALPDKLDSPKFFIWACRLAIIEMAVYTVIIWRAST